MVQDFTGLEPSPARDVRLAVLVWLRRKVPLVRPDRFMEIGWMVLLPAVVVQDLLVSLIVVSGG